MQLVLPLLRQTAKADHEAALEIATGDEFLHQEPSHDGLAGAGIVRQQEAKRLARQHCFVHRGDLVRQRFHLRAVDGEHRIEQMRQADAMGFGRQPVAGAVAVEAPRAALFGQLQPGFVVAVEDLLGNASAPCHCACTTVTGASGRMPRTDVFGFRSSSFKRARRSRRSVAGVAAARRSRPSSASPVGSRYESTPTVHAVKLLSRSVLWSRRTAGLVGSGGMGSVMTDPAPAGRCTPCVADPLGWLHFQSSMEAT